MDFDSFVELNQISSNELGEAFAAWLNIESGWDGPSVEVDCE